MEPEQKTNSNGALIGSIIVIVILIVGGIFLWQKKMDTEPQSPESQLGANESSDTTASMEADANGIDLDGLDNGI